MNEINAATFLTYLDEAVKYNKIGAQDYKTLVKDMSEILDAVHIGGIVNKIKIRKRRSHLEFEGPKYIRKYYEHIISSEGWYKDNNFEKLHRLGDKPAIINYHANRKVSSEHWALDGAGSRADDKPTTVEYYNNGTICAERWSQNGKLNRINDRPSSIEYFENGKIAIEEWYHEGKISRDNDKPAAIEYYSTGQVNKEIWYQHGKRKRDNGKPSRQIYDREGNVTYEFK